MKIFIHTIKSFVILAILKSVIFLLTHNMDECITNDYFYRSTSISDLSLTMVKNNKLWITYIINFELDYFFVLPFQDLKSKFLIQDAILFHPSIYIVESFKSSLATNLLIDVIITLS